MSDKSIDYFFSPVSPFTYMGHQRFLDLVAKHGLSVNYKPADLMEVFSVSGGLPVGKRAPQRQAYRMVELNRWKEFLGLPMNVQPKFFPISDLMADRVLVAAQELGGDLGKLLGGFLCAVWEKEQDISDLDTVKAIIAEAGQDAGLIEAAEDSKHDARLKANTQEAIDRSVFGAPTWIYNEEPFWGQDRLDLLAWRLGQG